MGVTAAMTLEIALVYILGLLTSGVLETVGELCNAKVPQARAPRTQIDEAKGSISTSESVCLRPSIGFFAADEDEVAVEVQLNGHSSRGKKTRSDVALSRRALIVYLQGRCGRSVDMLMVHAENVFSVIQ